MELETTIDKLNKATEEFEEKDALHMEVNTESINTFLFFCNEAKCKSCSPQLWSVRIQD